MLDDIPLKEVPIVTQEQAGYATAAKAVDLIIVCGHCRAFAMIGQRCDYCGRIS